MLQRFEGKDGRRLRIAAFHTQKMLQGNKDLAEELADRTEWQQLTKGDVLIDQDSDSNDMYFLIAGTFSVVVNGKQVAVRGPGDHVGEMAAIQPIQRRSANVIAADEGIVAKLSEPDFTEIAARYPELYRAIAQELARRLLERNKLVNVYREKIRVFIISSVEALPIARAIQTAFEHDFSCVVWTDGVFRVANYPLQDLETQIDDSDFAIAVAHADDMTESRDKSWPSPRDNVVFELGLFMGRLGRARAVLMEPREEKVKLPSDLTGITTITYRFEKGKDAAASLAPACNHLRDHINALGPNNG